MPSERMRQVTLIYRIFTFAAMNTTAKPLAIPGLELQGVDALRFTCPLHIQRDETDLQLQEAFELKSGQLLAVTGGTGAGKSTLLEAVLGVTSIQQGRIDLVSRSKTPWDWIRYLPQYDLSLTHIVASHYAKRVSNIEKILNGSAHHLIVVDDPLMGMDGMSRQRVLEMIVQAKRDGALLVLATNDRQIVQMADFWLGIQEGGEMQLRKMEAPA